MAPTVRADGSLVELTDPSSDSVGCTTDLMVRNGKTHPGSHQEVKDIELMLRELVEQTASDLLGVLGVGPDEAAALLVTLVTGELM